MAKHIDLEKKLIRLMFFTGFKILKDIIYFIMHCWYLIIGKTYSAYAKCNVFVMENISSTWLLNMNNKSYLRPDLYLIFTLQLLIIFIRNAKKVVFWIFSMASK